MTPEVADDPGRYPTAQLYMLRLVFMGQLFRGGESGGTRMGLQRGVGGMVGLGRLWRGGLGGIGGLGGGVGLCSWVLDF